MTFLQRYFHEVPQEDHNTGAIAFYASLDQVAKVAPSITFSIIQELRDQHSHLKMIASENFSSLAVQQAMGNLLTDKYAEGFPFHRFYAGCENVDNIEAEAVNELKILFGAEHAYVQPHSGSDANLVAYWAILTQRVQSAELERLGKKNINQLSDTEYEQVRKLLTSQKLLGMSLNSGGHLTHGYRQNMSSKMMQAATYEVDPETGYLDYNHVLERAEQEKPAILVAGYSAYPRKLNFAYLKEIADRVGAVFMVDMAHFAGLVAGKAYTDDYDPVPFADVITSTTHKTLRGPRGGIILCKKEYAEIIDKGCPLALGGPLPHVMAAKTVAFKEANHPNFQTYAKNIIKNAQALAEALCSKDTRILTGGTDNHMVLIDTRPYNITGRHAENILRDAHITVNRNAIPNDPNGPWYTSGIRVGTPALTTLGMGPEEMQIIGDTIHDLLIHAKPEGESKAKVTIDPTILQNSQARVKELLKSFPLYPELGTAYLETQLAS